MLNKFIPYVGAFLFVVAIFIWAENQIAPSFQSCVSQEAISDFIGSQTLCSIRLVDAHNGFFSAVAALVVAVFTIVLAVVTEKQARLTRDSIKLARDEFNAAHRPKIITHSVKYEPFVHESGDVDFDKIGASVIFYNTGENAATIEAIKYSIRQRITPLDSGIALIDTIPPKHKTIESGMGDYIEITSDIEIRTARQFSDPRSKVFLIGKIFYRDQRGACGKLAFVESGEVLPSAGHGTP